MRWQVTAVRGEREWPIGRPLPMLDASALRRLLVALQTDRDPIEYIIVQTTGFERLTLAPDC